MRQDVVLLNVFEDDILRPSQTIFVRAKRSSTRPTIDGVDLVLVPVDTTYAPIHLGQDLTADEPRVSEDCREGCAADGEFSVPVPSEVGVFGEGRAHLEVRVVGETDPVLSVPVYWDATPPRSLFVTPPFGAEVPSEGVDVQTTSSDDDIVSIEVLWRLVQSESRNTPLFEQHHLAGDLGEAASSPTAVAATLTWLTDTSQCHMVPPEFTPLLQVQNLAYFMWLDDPVGEGSIVGGLEEYLDFWLGYEEGDDYDIDAELTSGQPGLSPQQILEEFEAGGAACIYLRNLPTDVPFVHMVALDNVILETDGTASIRVMDPIHVPEADVGQYRWLHLNLDGTVDWLDADPGYHIHPPLQGPSSGKLRIYASLVVRNCHWFDFLKSPGEVGADGVPTSGTVPGTLQPDGHVWQGHFTPPTGSPGPWLLTTVTTDSSGHTMREFQHIAPPAR